jgi:organic radical activating enzyme
MNELIIPPTQLTFVTTNRCTAACQNCCFQCNPQNKSRLTLQEMKYYIDQSIKAYNTIKLLIITGGECFTLGRDLTQIIKHASSNGLFTRVITNGYWAKSIEKAYSKLKKLVEAGLDEINFSTGDEHQVWVSYDNLDKKLHIIGGAWMPFLKSSEEKINLSNNEDSKDSLIILQRKKRCSSLFNTISIDPFHQAIACCGLTVEYINYLKLGNAKKYSLKFLYEYQFQDFLKIWLFTEGPENILRFCRNKLNLHPIDTTQWHICQICVEIFRDEQNILILQQNYEEVFPNVMLKYSLLKEKYLKSIN